jgi:DNA-binding CsgD family transcriptional regulator
MDQRFRRGFTTAEKTELWDRWQRGESLKAIGRVFGKPSSSIHNQVAPHGGIRPALRRRSRLALTLSEREEISRSIAAHQSCRSVARLLGRSASTVSRELKRNGGYDRYRAAPADEQTWARSRRPKRYKLATSPSCGQKIKTAGKTGVIPSRRSLAACRPLGFLGRLRAPSRIGGQMGGDSWSGHVSWPTLRGRWTRSCCCGMSIWLLKTGS